MSLQSKTYWSIALLISLSSSCHKPELNPDDILHTCPPPDYLTLVVLDQQGHNLIHSSTDVVTTEPISGTTAHPLLNYVFRLHEAGRDTTRSTKYGGMGWAVYCSIPEHSIVGQTPVNRYRLLINGQLVGELYYSLTALDYSAGCYTKPEILFNEQVLTTDMTVIPFANIVHQ